MPSCFHYSDEACFCSEDDLPGHCHQCLERLVAGDVVEVPGEGSLCRECANDWQEETRNETTAVEVSR